MERSLDSHVCQIRTQWGLIRVWKRQDPMQWFLQVSGELTVADVRPMTSRRALGAGWRQGTGPISE